MELFKLAVAVALTAIFITYLPAVFEPKVPPIVEGYFQPEFMDVAENLRKNMESGKEMGAAFAVYLDGEPIIDMWAGYADREARRRWRNKTITLAHSVTKSLIALLFAIMVDRGYVNYSAPIADYWPAFRQNNKENITLEMFLSHQAGLPFLNSQINLHDLRKNPVKIEELLAEQETVWPAGLNHGFHTYTYGLYLDRLIEKIDPNGRDTAKIFQEEITYPFDIDFFMNLPRSECYRTARLQSFSLWRNKWQMLTSLKYLKAYYDFFTNPLSIKSGLVFRELEDMTACYNNQELREITMSSSMGTGTARGLAKLFSILAGGGKYIRRQLLSPEIIRKLSTQLTSGKALMFPSIESQWGRGVLMIKNPLGEQTFGAVGYGGQVVIADPSNKLGIAYLTNYLSVYGSGDDPRFLDLHNALYKNLDRYLSRVKKNS